MVVNRAVKWVVGVALVVLLSLVPSTCIDWKTDERAVAAEAAATNALGIAEQFRQERDSARQEAFALGLETTHLKRRLAAVRQEIPPPPAPVPGCEPCEARAELLEEALTVADSVIASQGAEILALDRASATAIVEANGLRSALQDAQQALARLAEPRAELRISRWRKLLPSASVGYGVMPSLEEQKLRLRRGPVASLGWRISL